MSAEAILHKVASTLSLYEPKSDEEPIIHFLVQQQLIMPVTDGKRYGYHITLNGVKWRQAKAGHHQGPRR
jgi:hypothetical protein